MRARTIRCLSGLVFAAALCWSVSASAYDYIGHTYFTDRACLEAQRKLGKRIQQGKASSDTVARYLALSLTCPERWDKPYCVDGYKQYEAGLNRLESPPDDSGDLAATLGDFAALPDHLSRFGPIRGIRRIGKFGLTLNTWLWLTGEPGDAGGVIGDVAEDACETDGTVPWTRVEQDIDAALERFAKNDGYEAEPEKLLSPIARTRVPQGPSDPAGQYSFDNPHYLDLVLRNHHHFGALAFSTWLGFHSAAVSVDTRTCEQVIAFDDDQLDDLADDMPGFEDIDWDDLSRAQQRHKGCQLMRAAIRKRLLEWEKRADPRLVAPVKGIVDSLETSKVEGDVVLDDVAVAMTSLVMEGTGLHFLQDGLASGHMRTIRSKEQLEAVRYDHDADNRDGVVALLQTRSGEFPFVAFGDTYLLGPSVTKNFVDCDWDKLAKGDPSPKLVTACIIQEQRGILVASTTASLVDWALGGTLYDAPTKSMPEAPTSCSSKDPLYRYVCRMLPARPTMVTGQDDNSGRIVLRMHHGSIPVPPPVFSYESLMFNVGLEATGEASQFGLHLNLLRELDSRANWMISHRMGLRMTIGSGELNQFMADYAFGFHWRWSARFTVDARPEVFAGLRGLNNNVAFFTGIAPSVSITALPEGWTKLPLELTLGYRLPLVFYGSDNGFFGDVVSGHWIMFGLGLAYM